MLCFHLSLFNFQSAIAVFSSVIFSLAVPACLLYHIFFILSSTFSKFLEVFSSFCFLYLPFFWQPDYYITNFRVCQGVLQKFLSFFQAVFAIQWSWLVFLFFLLPSLRQLRYNNTKYPICQPLFELFSLLNKLTNFHILPLCIFYTTGSHFLYTSPFKWVS